jgi:uncharacterized protein
MRKMADDGVTHEKQILDKTHCYVLHTVNDAAAYQQTIECMKRGESNIYGGTVIFENFIGRPDILKKVSGKSSFGKFSYEAVDIKSGKHLKEEYRMQIMFYSYILEKISEKAPIHGRVINSENKELVFDTADEKTRFNEIFEKIKLIINGKDEHPVICSRCSECVWKEFCFEKAKEIQDLSLIYRLTRVQKNSLLDKGIKTLSDLAKANISTLSDDVLSVEQLKRFKIHANVLLKNEAYFIEKPKLPKSKVEVFLDVECENDLGVDYLYGVLIRSDGVEKYIPFWADGPADERRMWQDFCDFLITLEDFKIYHYTHYEVQSIVNLTKKYGIDTQLKKRIDGNMIDLFKYIDGKILLPIYTYSIKSIAKWLGFSWSSPKAGGAQSMVWYQKWTLGDKTMKDIIIEYNRDDCEATKIVFDWLRSIR